MEQRNSERKAVSLDAVIACSRFGLIRGRIRDLASEGLYVSAETSIVPIGSDVSVTFQPGTGICEGCLTFKGRVSHQSLQGFGIEFQDVDSQCAGLLNEMLMSLPPVPQYAVPVLRAG